MESSLEKVCLAKNILFYLCIPDQLLSRVQLCDPMDWGKFFCPYYLSGKNTGLGCHFYLQEIFQTKDKPLSPALTGVFVVVFFLNHWVTWEDHLTCKITHLLILALLLELYIYILSIIYAFWVANLQKKRKCLFHIGWCGMVRNIFGLFPRFLAQSF